MIARHRYRRIREFFITDRHCPALNVDAFCRALDFYDDNAGDESRIIDLGDGKDINALSRFVQTIRPAKQEEFIELERSQNLWCLTEIAARSKRKAIYIPGNHCDRVKRMVKSTNPYLDLYVVDRDEAALSDIPNLEVHPYPVRIKNDPYADVFAEHGEGGSRVTCARGRRVAQMGFTSVVNGHLHGLGATWVNDQAFVIEAGMLGDPTHELFNFDPLAKDGRNNWRVGCAGIWDDGTPFIEAYTGRATR